MSLKAEEKVLKLSMVSLAVFAVLGIGFGVFLESEVILFDGIFSIIDIIIGYLTLRLIRYVRKHDYKKFPFGKENIEPFFVFVQYLMLNVILIYMLVFGVQMILNGGNPLNINLVLVYLLITTLIQYFFLRIMIRAGKKTESVIVKAEIHQWKLSLRESYYILGGYLMGAIFLFFKESTIVNYIDPVILIIFVIVAFNQTIEEMVNAFKEIIGMRTIKSEGYDNIENIVKAVQKKYDIKDYYIKLKKVGSMLVLEIDFLIDHEFKSQDVFKQDEIREGLYEKLSNSNYNLTLTVVFTSQLKWIKH